MFDPPSSESLRMPLPADFPSSLADEIDATRTAVLADTTSTAQIASLQTQLATLQQAEGGLKQAATDAVNNLIADLTAYVQSPASPVADPNAPAA